ncbi:YppG family protein [Salirhabdus sp. Marseille-P4669]|uniref:YppG family protein n=1 Tax=Salirhabdus sp. Marseille-P4669 TaxID=2042310 RepID=UPI000C7E0751|nr:YppG family protein [Salirhabdus sp. Marseille-P4669]
MNHQWGQYHNGPVHYVPPSFPPKFPFQSTPNQGQPVTPYENFQKPPIPLNSYGNQTQVQKGMNPIIQQFQNSNGQIDFDKVFSTVGQIVNTVNQVQPLVKQFGSIMKGFK